MTLENAPQISQYDDGNAISVLFPVIHTNTQNNRHVRMGHYLHKPKNNKKPLVEYLMFDALVAMAEGQCCAKTISPLMQDTGNQFRQLK